MNRLPAPDQTPSAFPRVKRVRVAAECLEALLMLDGTRRVRTFGMPDDARVVHVGWDDERAEANVVVLSDTFAPVAPGQEVPELDLRAEVLPGPLDYTLPKEN